MSRSPCAAALAANGSAAPPDAIILPLATAPLNPSPATLQLLSALPPCPEYPGPALPCSVSVRVRYCYVQYLLHLPHQLDLPRYRRHLRSTIRTMGHRFLIISHLMGSSQFTCAACRRDRRHSPHPVGDLNLGTERQRTIFDPPAEPSQKEKIATHVIKINEITSISFGTLKTADFHFGSAK